MGLFFGRVKPVNIVAQARDFSCTMLLEDDSPVLTLLVRWAVFSISYVVYQGGKPQDHPIFDGDQSWGLSVIIVTSFV